MQIVNVGNRIMNTYLYPIADGYVIIDTGYEDSYKRVLSRMSNKGIDIKNVRYVFLTHAHDDHAGFLNELLTKNPHIKCIVHEESVIGLIRGQNSFEGGCSSRLALIFCKIMSLFGKGEHRFPCLESENMDRLIRVSRENADEVGALIDGKILFTPGHTADSISVKVRNMIFCGDAAMNGLPSLRRTTIWIENVKDYKKSWDILISESSDLLYPAHGRPFSDSELIKYNRYLLKMKLYDL